MLWESGTLDIATMLTFLPGEDLTHSLDFTLMLRTTDPGSIALSKRPSVNYLINLLSERKIYFI